jgi:hypothetical protein
MTNKDKRLVQQLITTLMPIIIQITTNLPTHTPKGSYHQPLDGGQPKNSLGGSSPMSQP